MEKIKLCKIPETRNCVLKSFHLSYTNVQNKCSEGVTPQWPEDLSWEAWVVADGHLSAVYWLIYTGCYKVLWPEDFPSSSRIYPKYMYWLASRKHANIFNNKHVMPAINTACLIFHLLTLTIGSQLDWDTSLSFTWLYEFYWDRSNQREWEPWE